MIRYRIRLFFNVKIGVLCNDPRAGIEFQSCDYDSIKVYLCPLVPNAVRTMHGGQAHKVPIIQTHIFSGQNLSEHSVLKTSEEKVGNPFNAYPPKVTAGPPPLSCATEYQQQPQFFRLPAASPFDNLKAAGCWCDHMDSWLIPLEDFM